MDPTMDTEVEITPELIRELQLDRESDTNDPNAPPPVKLDVLECLRRTEKPLDAALERCRVVARDVGERPSAELGPEWDAFLEGAAFSLDEKVVVVTGASRGIGEAIAIRLAQRGANVALLATSWNPNPSLPGTIGEAWERCRAVRHDEDCVIGVRCDITNGGEVDYALNQITKKWGRIDVVINNASTHWPKTVAETDRRRYDKMMGVNVKGAYIVTTACMPWLVKSQNAHVLTIAPAALPDHGWLAPHACYTASKVGMSLLSIALEAEFRDTGVAFNTLWPRHAVATAATSFIGGDRLLKVSRTPAIVADAAFRVVVSPANFLSGHAFSDRDVLRSCGITDFTAYNVDPDMPHAPVSDFFVRQTVPSPTFADPATLRRKDEDGDVSIKTNSSEGTEDAGKTRSKKGVVLVLCDEDCDFIRPVCTALLQEGHRVVVLAHVRANVNDLNAARAFDDESVRKEITSPLGPKLGREALLHLAVKHGDLSDADGLVTLMHECAGRFFAVDALVNLLYTEIHTGHVPHHEHCRPGRVYGEPIDEELDVKLRASFILVARALPHVLGSVEGPRRIVNRCAPPSHAFVPTDDGAGDVVTYAGDVVNDVREALQGYHTLAFAAEFATGEPNPVAVNGLCFDTHDAMTWSRASDDSKGSSERFRKIDEFAAATVALLSQPPIAADDNEGKAERAHRIAGSTFWRVRDVLAGCHQRCETADTRVHDKNPTGVHRREYTDETFVFPENDRDVMNIMTRFGNPVYNMTTGSVKGSEYEAEPVPPGFDIPEDPMPRRWFDPPSTPGFE